MKSIEEKASDYAINMNERCDGLFNCRSLFDEYITGATEALADQWRSVEDGLPKDQRDVFVRFVNYAGGVEYSCAYYDGEDWYTTDGLTIRPTHWLPIPELPKHENK